MEGISAPWSDRGAQRANEYQTKMRANINTDRRTDKIISLIRVYKEREGDSFQGSRKNHSNGGNKRTFRESLELK